MNGIWLPLAATALAATLTWWFCVRPMTRGRSCHGAPAADEELREELRRAREELRDLRDKATPTAARNTGPETLDR
ncbi:hypothetical protein [Streptomyces sp. NPDC002205]|uniref:hypothetical protein n=1 Tax=Streptomyces sp. NPDC002205 TaxID=3154411 RepID=UPI0033271B3D